ncbi:hypothetical protein LTR93_011758 [Exophiala xenobiotica]|nr:hypothetical protein LTR93_011758 [Exophiala xenobiotica]
MDCNDADLGTAFSITGIMLTIRTVVGTVGAAVFVAILQNTVLGKITKLVPAAATKAGLSSSSLSDLFTAIATGYIAAVNKVLGMTSSIKTAVLDALATAYGQAYAYVYYAAVAFGCVGLIACACVKNYDNHSDNHVSRQIDAAKDTDQPPDEKSAPAEKTGQRLEILEMMRELLYTVKLCIVYRTCGEVM